MSNTDLIAIETTNICPAHCVICPREKFTQKLGIMDLKLFEKIIDDASTYNIKLVGPVGFGDPLADPKFFERCKYIRKKLPKAKIYISTTGFFHKFHHLAIYLIWSSNTRPFKINTTLNNQFT